MKTKRPDVRQPPILLYFQTALTSSHSNSETVVLPDRQAELDKQKAMKTKRPDPGASRPGQLGVGGRVGASGGSLLTQHVLRQQVRP